MLGDASQRLAEYHERAANGHPDERRRTASSDHLSGAEMSRQAVEHARKAFEFSRTAHRACTSVTRARAQRSSTRQPRIWSVSAAPVVLIGATR